MLKNKGWALPPIVICFICMVLNYAKGF